MRGVIGTGDRRDDEAEVNFAPFGRGRGSRVAGYPRVHRAEFDLDEGDGAVGVRAHVGTGRSDCKGGTRNPMDYLRAVDEYLLGAGAPLRRAPGAGAGPASRRWTSSSTSRHEGYCQHFAGAMALMLRMGGDSGAGRHRLHARRLLGAPQGVDRARHRRARLGRGLVRPVRLGHRRPDAGRDPGPLAGRARCRAAESATPRSRTADPGADAAANGEADAAQRAPGAAGGRRRAS